MIHRSKHFTIVLAAAVFLTLSCTVIADEVGNASLRAEILNVRYEHVNYQAQREIVLMDGVLEYLRNSTNVSEADLNALAETKAKFKDALTVLKSKADAGDKEGFDSALKDMRDYAKDFAKKTKEVVKGGNVAGLKTYLKEKLNGEKDALDSLKNDAWSNEEKAKLLVLDTHLDIAERRLEKLKNRSVSSSNVSFDSMETVLEKIREDRNYLVQAFSEKNRSMVRSIEVEVRGYFKNLRELERQTLKAVFDKRAERVFEIARNVLVKSDVVLDKLEAKGFNVSVYREGLNGVNATVQSAKSECDAGEYKKCLELYKAAKERVKELEQELRKDVKERGKPKTGGGKKK